MKKGDKIYFTDTSKISEVVSIEKDSCTCNVGNVMATFPISYIRENAFVIDTDKYDSFRKITQKLCLLFLRKNHDYGDSFSELYKEDGMMISYLHLREKIKRVKQLTEGDAMVHCEGIKDSLLDIANYAIMTLMELDKKNDK